MPVVALLTDFGSQDHYVGAMRGAILTVCPEATLVDLAHEIPAHDVTAGALALASAWRDFPAQTVFVAVVDGHPVGFVAVALNAFHERMGAIEIVGVDPDHQRTGVGARLTEHALDHMRAHGMTIAVVETGGDPGHAPARELYAATGFTVLPSRATFDL